MTLEKLLVQEPVIYFKATWIVSGLKLRYSLEGCSDPKESKFAAHGQQCMLSDFLLVACDRRNKTTSCVSEGCAAAVALQGGDSLTREG